VCVDWIRMTGLNAGSSARFTYSSILASMQVPSTGYARALADKPAELVGWSLVLKDSIAASLSCQVAGRDGERGHDVNPSLDRFAVLLPGPLSGGLGELGLVYKMNSVGKG
jgi:hypothetical protein